MLQNEGCGGPLEFLRLSVQHFHEWGRDCAIVMDKVSVKNEQNPGIFAVL